MCTASKTRTRSRSSTSRSRLLRSTSATRMAQGDERHLWSLDPMEKPMFKSLSILATLGLLAGGAANAQQREATLQKLEVPGVDFDIVLAMPKAPHATFDLGMSPEATIIHLTGGELALGFETGEQMLAAVDSLRSPVGAFQVRQKRGGAPAPIAVYVVAKNAAVASAQK